MEFKNSPDYKGIVNEDNNSKKLYMLLSLSSWLLLLISGWICFAVPDFKFGREIKQLFFWCYHIIRTNEDVEPFPLYIHYIVFYMIAIITLLSITIAIIVYLYSIFIKKDANAINGMLGNISQFHFIPLLCISALFIIGETLEEDKIFHYEYPFKGIYYFFNLLFTVFALSSLIFISFNTKIQSNTYMTWSVKSCAYSCMIALLMHNLGYIISNYGFYLHMVKNKSDNAMKRWLKGTTISFSFLIGFGNLIISIVLKQMIIAVMNILIYVGMIVQFFKIDKKTRNRYYSVAPGVIEAFILFFSLLVIAFLFIRNKGLSNFNL